jgi:dipeptidyl aminopeptidase/acylaminoacyl peptidase
VRQVAPGAFYDWSPDGCQILGVDAKTNLSPDGEFFIVNQDGTNRRDIGPGSYPVWMPGGRGIVYWNEERLYRYELETRTVTEIPVVGFPPGPMQISPDGTLIAPFVFDDYLYVLDFATGTQRLIAVAADFGRSNEVAWSPDSSRIAYQDANLDSVYIFDIAGGTRTTISGVERIGSLGWSPDGSKLILAEDAGFNSPTIAVMNVDKDPKLVFAIEGYHPKWSPDGKQIVYATGGQVFVINADGTGARKLYEGTSPLWIPPVREMQCK